MSQRRARGFVPLEARPQGGHGSKKDLKKAQPGKLSAISEDVPGFITLYKDISRIRADTWFQEGDVKGLLSSPPTDMGAISTNYSFWTVELEIAEKYKRWSRKTLGESPPLVLQLKISNALIAHLKPCILRADTPSSRAWNPEHWKQCIWHSRRGQHHPRSISFIAKQKLIIAHLSGGTASSYQKGARFKSGIQRLRNSNRRRESKTLRDTTYVPRMAFTRGIARTRGHRAVRFAKSLALPRTAARHNSSKCLRKLCNK